MGVVLLNLFDMFFNVGNVFICIIGVIFWICNIFIYITLLCMCFNYWRDRKSKEKNISNDSL